MIDCKYHSIDLKNEEINGRYSLQAIQADNSTMGIQLDSREKRVGGADEWRRMEANESDIQIICIHLVQSRII